MAENSENDMDLAALAIIELRAQPPQFADKSKKRGSYESNMNVTINISFDSRTYNYRDSDDPDAGFYEDNEESEEGVRTKKSKRIGVFSDDISSTLNKWVDAHRSNPYPTGAEKLHLCEITGLNLTQIDNWMSNARRRKLKVRSKRGCQNARK
jgi:hypothetical protein